MKKYVKPTMNGEMFVANEYVGACFVVECNVPGGTDYEYLYSETNGEAGLQTTANNGVEADKLLLKKLNISGCGGAHIGVIHNGSSTLPYNGYWVYEKYLGWGNYETITLDVYWWEEKLGSNYDYHATATPETAYSNPNAS